MTNFLAQYNKKICKSTDYKLTEYSKCFISGRADSRPLFTVLEMEGVQSNPKRIQTFQANRAGNGKHCQFRGLQSSPSATQRRKYAFP